MRLWGKTQAELDAERQQAIARREAIARRDQAAHDRLVADFVCEAPRATATSPQALGAYYAPLVSGSEIQRQYFFGEDIERFDSVPSEMHAFGRQEAAAEPYGWRWAAVIALTVLAIGMIAMALAMLP